MDSFDANAGQWVPEVDNDELDNQLRRRQVEAMLFGASVAPKIGRFEIERQLGRGGMGEVYLGRDAELQRPVAVKLLHPHLYEGADSRARERARREGLALAKVSHPNVIEVFEIGEHEGRPFVAMEYVEGRTLRTWLEQDEPAWREIVTVFIAAGRGLHAAHRAGLVHRDFKLDNVLISGTGGDERRVRVLDFGLARLSGLDELRLDSTVEDGPSELTVAGTVLGTLPYMSPEQLDGEAADAASDQFSFCVALYRALWRADPFMGGSVRERRACMEARAATPPQGHGRALWPVIRRGLARDPSQRWPSMAELLDGLERAARRRRLAPGLALASLGLSLGLIFTRATEPNELDDPCGLVEARGAELWSGARAEQARARFEASAQDFARPSFVTVDAALQQWSRAWTDQRTQLCRSGADADPRATCLDRAHVEVSLLTKALAEADAQTVAHAVESLSALPSLHACEINEDAMLGLAPVPAGVEAELSEARVGLAEGRVLRLTGHLDQARARLDALAGVAGGLAYAPFVAELAVERALLGLDLAKTGDAREPLSALEAAATLAESSRHDRLAAIAWTVLAQWGAMPGAADDAQVEDWIGRAEVNVRRLDQPVDLQARLECMHGTFLARQPDQAEAARAPLERSLGLFAELDRGDITRVWRPACALRLAALLPDDERWELGEQAVNELEALYGPAHPKVADLRFELARLLLDTELPAARARGAELLEQLAARWAADPSEASSEAAYTYVSLAAAAYERGETEQARRHAALARELLARGELPEDDYQHALPLLIEAQLDYDAGEFEAALAAYDRARTFVLGKPGFAAYLASIDRARALCLVELDRLADADALILGLRPGEGEDPELDVVLGRVALRRGQLDRARALLDLDAADVLVLDALARLQAGRAVDCDALAAELATLDTVAHEEFIRDMKATEAQRRCLGSGYDHERRGE